MLRKWLPRFGFAVLALSSGFTQVASAQPPAAPAGQPPLTRYYMDGTVYGPGGGQGMAVATQPQPTLPRFYYYPYYYFPHSYWPQNSPQWPEPKGHPYVRPPAYQAYPAFKEPGWRYELWTPMRYYRGSHFWLDQF